MCVSVYVKECLSSGPCAIVYVSVDLDAEKTTTNAG